MADPKGQWGLLLAPFAILNKLSFTIGKTKKLHAWKKDIVG